MNFLEDKGIWDLLLMVSVLVQTTIIAYVYKPNWKAFILTLPVPFSFSTLAVGAELGTACVIGMIVLWMYTHGVRILHCKFKLSIIPSIAISAIGYCLLSSLLLPLVTKIDGDLAFWIALAAVYAGAVVLYVRRQHHNEQGHRSPLPLWKKLPAITIVIVSILAIKAQMQGFMTLFPFVGVVAAYEARHSLQTICRQIPVLAMCMLPLMGVIRLTQNAIGLGPAILVGWIAFLIALWVVTRHMWAADANAASEQTKKILVEEVSCQPTE